MKVFFALFLRFFFVALILLRESAVVGALTVNKGGVIRGEQRMNETLGKAENNW